MKVSVVGCGGVSANHFDALSRLGDVEITAVCDIKKERADEKAAQTGAKAYYDFISNHIREYKESLNWIPVLEDEEDIFWGYEYGLWEY